MTNTIHAFKVATVARFVTEYRARAAFQFGVLHGIFLFLIPTEEPTVRVSGSPNAYNTCSNERSKMHIGTVHRNHDVKMAN